MLNWALLKNPLNWLVVILMLIIAGFVVDIFVTHLGHRIDAQPNGAAASAN